jgi:four helix bundle protein
MATVQRFEDLRIWQEARELCKDIHKLIVTTDIRTNFRLRDQMEGSSGSIMDNIAEGFERGGNKEFSQFLWIAKGSCGELRSQLYRVLDKEYVGQDVIDPLVANTVRLSKGISSFLTYLSRSEIKGNRYKDPENRNGTNELTDNAAQEP